jgi:uncharacterized membrane protein YebE (DUF533 family)
MKSITNLALVAVAAGVAYLLYQDYKKGKKPCRCQQKTSGTTPAAASTPATVAADMAKAQDATTNTLNMDGWK